MKSILVFCVVGLVIVNIASAQNSMLEKLVNTEKAFAAAAANTSVRQAFIEYCAEDGIVFQPVAVNAREFWQLRSESPALLAWTPAWADISNDGVLGYTTGDWDYRPAGKDDTPVTFGQYITIWKLQTNGEFRAVLDIGITHQKPDVVSNQWNSPAEKQSVPFDASNIAEPELGLYSLEQYESSLAQDARLYRNSKLPFIGKQAALKEIESGQADIMQGKIIDAGFDRSGNLCYGYGVLELLKTDGSAEKGNLMRIWKRQNDNWQIVLEVYVPIPTNCD